jgi:hypothetical protein
MRYKSFHIILFAVLCAGLASCEKKEALWELPAAGPETVETLNLGPDYENVIYYQLSTQRSQMANLFVWDIAFATGAGEHHIVMNGGRDVQCYNTNDTDFYKTTYATTKVAWQWDNPNGMADSTAVGDWLDTTHGVSANRVYIFDLGKSISPRYRKVKFLGVSGTGYTIKVANIDNSGAYETVVAKDATKNLVHFNLVSGQVVAYEPPSTEWDLLFTRYRHIYFDLSPPEPYILNGVMINMKHISVAEVNTMKFEDINAEKAAGITFTKKQDEIGFDWKTYLFETGKYVIGQNKVYVLKTSEGVFYKFRFVDFYSDQGVKGYPKFIFQRL